MDIYPPLLNSANPWATTLSDLRELWDCPHTGAVTTRTALLGGFPHDGKKHRFCLFDTHGFGSVSESSDREILAAAYVGEESEKHLTRMNASLNTLGYSYHTLDEYLGFISEIVSESAPAPTKTTSTRPKWFIVSVTGTPADVAECYRRISALQNQGRQVLGKQRQPLACRLAMEVNLSCPNIPDKPPPAYSGEALREYITAVATVSTELESVTSCLDADIMKKSAVVKVPWGVKTPPYTFAGQFEQLMSALRVDTGGKSAISFVTATNTLGSCLVLAPPLDSEQKHQPALPGFGIGGMAGAPLHPIALGNVATLARLVSEHPSTQHVSIIGIGGVEDAGGYRRMRDVGASAVGVGTALGSRGVGIFGDIAMNLEGQW
ncbi:dihydroorotate dehydrogenase (fumarate) [Microdochium nivale]|nr:dihydroorotate dehydrogenase (fumarate) [Microdochium nivale]